METFYPKFNPFPNKPLFFTCLLCKSFKNTVEKGEIARNEQFLLFLQCFLLPWRTSRYLLEYKNCRLQLFQFGRVKNFVVWENVNPFPIEPWFLCVCSTSLLKTLWEKQKLLVTSIFSISHSVFYLLDNFLPFSSNSKLLSANFFG